MKSDWQLIPFNGSPRRGGGYYPSVREPLIVRGFQPGYDPFFDFDVRRLVVPENGDGFPQSLRAITAE